MSRFKQDQTAREALSQTVKLADVKSEDTIRSSHVAGHGPIWDLAESSDSIGLVELWAPGTPDSCFQFQLCGADVIEDILNETVLHKYGNRISPKMRLRE
jgi:hypothetical protein